MEPQNSQRDPRTGEIIDAAIKVHSHFRHGCLEKVYQTCLAHELRKRGVPVRTEVPMPVVYDDQYMECGYRIDLLVHESIVVEIKAQRQMGSIEEAQLLNYLALSGLHVGLLLNFALPKLEIKRLVLDYDQ